jgi:hypothetical protein
MSGAKEVPRGKFIVINAYKIKNKKNLKSQFCT